MNTNFSSFLNDQLIRPKNVYTTHCTIRFVLQYDVLNVWKFPIVSNNGFIICIDVMFNTLSLNLMLPNSLTSPFFVCRWKTYVCCSTWNLQVHYYAFDVMVSEFGMLVISGNRAINIDKCKEYVNFSRISNCVDFWSFYSSTTTTKMFIIPIFTAHNSHVFRAWLN